MFVEYESQLRRDKFYMSTLDWFVSDDAMSVLLRKTRVKYLAAINSILKVALPAIRLTLLCADHNCIATTFCHHFRRTGSKSLFSLRRGVLGISTLFLHIHPSFLSFSSLILASSPGGEA